MTTTLKIPRAFSKKRVLYPARSEPCLTNHVETLQQHVAYQRYACCENEYASEVVLRRHREAHADLTYTCLLCLVGGGSVEFTTRFSDVIVRHVRSVHRALDETSKPEMEAAAKKAIQEARKSGRKFTPLRMAKKSLEHLKDAIWIEETTTTVSDAVSTSSSSSDSDSSSTSSASPSVVAVETKTRDRCLDCGDYFASGSDLETHRRTTHGVSTTAMTMATMMCKECGKGFKWSRDYDRHMMVHAQAVEH